MKIKLAILGAGYLQKPLILKAKEMGIEAHVFAREEGSVAKELADFFYPVTFTEKKTIYDLCSKLKINGIITIGAEQAMDTVNYVAHKLDLTTSTSDAYNILTNKFLMRKKLDIADIKCPKYQLFSEKSNISELGLSFPVIVKPTDSEGSVGVTKVESKVDMPKAVTKAIKESKEKKCIIEEFVEGREFSIEMISLKGKHHYLTVTDKITTGAPSFIEIAHHQPAQIDKIIENSIVRTAKAGLNALGFKNGASHTEVKLAPDGNVYIIEVGGRMGGCLIGSDLVYHSTGYDYVKGVIEIAMGITEKEFFVKKPCRKFAGVYYIIQGPGTIKSVRNNTRLYPSIVKVEILKGKGQKIDDISLSHKNRAARFVYVDDNERLEFDLNNVINIETN